MPRRQASAMRLKVVVIVLFQEWSRISCVRCGRAPTRATRSGCRSRLFDAPGFVGRSPGRSSGTPVYAFVVQI